LSAILFYYLLGITPTADFISAPLETKYKPIVSPEKIKGIKAIVVLGGGVQPAGRLWPIDQVKRPTAFRLLETVRLYRSMDDNPYIIISTGKANPFLQDYTECGIMAEFVKLTGIPNELIIQENRSRNTYENGKYTVAILKKKGLDHFILVTSSMHMPRAMAVFLKLGVNPLPAPTDFKSTSGNYTILSFFPNTGNIGRFTSAIYEYLGLIWYRINGYI